MGLLVRCLLTRRECPRCVTKRSEAPDSLYKYPLLPIAAVPVYRRAILYIQSMMLAISPQSIEMLGKVRAKDLVHIALPIQFEGG